MLKNYKYNFAIEKVEFIFALILKCPKRGVGMRAKRVSGSRGLMAEPRKEFEWLLASSISQSQPAFVSRSSDGGQVSLPANLVGL